MNTNPWKEIIEKVTGEWEYYPPATSNQIQDLEKKLSVKLPDDLKEFLLESNGSYEGSAYLKIIWSVEEIIKENLRVRNDSRMAETYMRFDSLLFFSSAGVDGVLFAFPVSATGLAHSRNIMKWEPLEDNRVVVAFSLKDYLEKWPSGQLKI